MCSCELYSGLWGASEQKSFHFKDDKFTTLLLGECYSDHIIYFCAPHIAYITPRLPIIQQK